MSKKEDPVIKKVTSKDGGAPEEKKGESHFKSVLKELEENVSSDDDDDNNEKDNGTTTQADKN